MAAASGANDFEEQLINQLLMENASIDQTAPAIFKTVIAAGRQTEFLSALTAFAARKDKEIERTCHQHFQHFARSIDELLGLRREVAALKEAALGLQEELGQCGQLLLDTKVEMYETRKMYEGTRLTVSALGDCLAALNVAQQATLEISDRNYGQALRLMEQLQGSLLPRIEQFSFARKLYSWLPMQLSAIRAAALDELSAWLEMVRSRGPLIGQLAFERAQRRIERWKELYEGITTPTALNASAAEDTRSAAAYIDLVEMEREDAASIITASEQAQLDFGPLLQAVHLFDLMNRRDEFQALFAEYRRAQAKVIFDMPVSLKDGSPGDGSNSFAAFLHHVCGFFICEYFIVRKPQKFYSPAHVEGLWETAVRLINGYVLESLGSALSDQGLFMKIKWLQVFFLHAIEVYDLYSISSMLDTILSLFYRYVDLSKAEHHQNLQVAAQAVDLCPLTVSSSSAYARYQRQFAFLSAIVQDGGGPTSSTNAALPFSQYVLDVHGSLHDFIVNFYVFLEGVPQQSSELDDIARKTADWLLKQSAMLLLERVSTAETDGVIQIIKDFDCLARICEDVARLLTQKRTRMRDSPVALPSAVESFVKAKNEAEGRLFEAVNRELDRVLQSRPYEYHPAQAPVSPSDLFNAFVQFYQRTRQRLETAEMPSDAIRQVKLNMFSHLAGFLASILYDKSVASINMNFVQGLKVDLEAIEALANVEDPLILETFAETKQLVMLMLAEQVHEFLDPIVRNRKYPNLRSGEIVQVLQKVKEPMSVRRNFEDMILLLR